VGSGEWGGREKGKEEQESGREWVKFGTSRKKGEKATRKSGTDEQSKRQEDTLLDTQTH
jgi:hypothetical protein